MAIKNAPIFFIGILTQSQVLSGADHAGGSD
jgi:hypothetical protein